MKSREAIRALAELSESQWGMATSAQAKLRGVSHMNLTRLTESGDLVRLSHGIYKDAGAPSGEYDDLHAAWLAAEPTKFAWERLKEKPGTVVVSGESASRLHGIGELRAVSSEFTTPTRRQTQRHDVHYRTRVLTIDDVTIREGLPVTTRERTIADLVESRQDLSLVGHALRDAARQSRINVERLADLLSPLAERNGHQKSDGGALLDDLMRLAGIDSESIAKQMVAIPSLGNLITEKYLANVPTSEVTKHLVTPEMLSVMKSVATIRAALEAPIQSEALNTMFMPSSEALAAIQAAMSVTIPVEPNLYAKLAEQLNAIDWAALALATQPTKDTATEE